MLDYTPISDWRNDFRPTLGQCSHGDDKGQWEFRFEYSDFSFAFRIKHIHGGFASTKILLLDFGDDQEFITGAEHDSRIAIAEEHGETYDKEVATFSKSYEEAIIARCQECLRRFEAIQLITHLSLST